MKIINEENYNTSNTEIEKVDSLSDYFMFIKKAINDETTAIALYDKILKTQIPAASKEIIQEILDDEKDHLVILTELLNDEIEKELPEYGDEDIVIENDEE